MYHIPADSLDLYALGRVNTYEAMAVEEHLLVCASCVATFTEGLRLVVPPTVQHFTSELLQAHHTGDGLVFLYVRPVEEQRWIATLRGPNIDGGIVATARGIAVTALSEQFRLMFPEHVCTNGCITRKSGNDHA